MKAKIFLVAILSGLLLSVLAFNAHSCPMCLGGRSISISAQELVYAQNSVLALPDAHGTSFRVVEVIKGDVRPDTIITEKVLKLDPIAVRGSQTPLLLIRDDSWPNWVNFGPVSSNAAPELRKFAATKRSAGLDDAQWVTHVTFFLPYLENPEPMISAIAYTELSSAPHTALRALKPYLDSSTLRKAFSNPVLADHQPLYMILLGIAIDSQDVAHVQRQFNSVRQTITPSKQAAIK